MKKIIYYSVQNGGDGSAYPHFVETQKLADFDQNHMSEGWGESCTGELVIKGDNIEIENVQSELGYLLQKWFDKYNDDEEEECKEIKDEFFSKGLPKMSVTKRKDGYWNINVGKKIHHTESNYSLKTKEDVIKELDALIKL